ncbi:hypothetical protein ERO13_D01G038032v2 [Gossypium hirsutum]|nr:hypothetical protein ERO13_D01G038032v2 [Gossypium hirsutum]
MGRWQVVAEVRCGATGARVSAEKFRFWANRAYRFFYIIIGFCYFVKLFGFGAKWACTAPRLRY